MSGTRSLYSAARTPSHPIQNLFLLIGQGHGHHPSCQHHHLSFLINTHSRPRVRVLSRTKPSLKRSLSSSSLPLCQAIAYQVNIDTPMRRRSRDHHLPRPEQRKGAISPRASPRLQSACYSTTTGTSNTQVSNNNGSSGSDANVSGDSYPYPYSDPDFLDFEQCKNPVQLEKSIASYLRSHPEPTDQALIAMLTACANLCRATISPMTSWTTHHPRKQQQQHQQRTRLPKDKRKSESNKASTSSAPPNLLETILQSSVFSSDQVFKIARSIHSDLSARPYSESGIIQDLPSRQRTSSLQVTNAFLDICAITGHFDEAKAILQEMLDSPQGDVKPDLTTYRHVLRAAVVAQRHQSTVAMQGQDQNQARRSSIDTSVQEVIDQAAEALSKKARMAFWIKLGLGGLTGATVGKFTMMAIMALPVSRPLEDGVERNSGESTSTHMIDSLQPTEGIMEFLATQEVATGIGLAVGMLTAGYFILGSTRRPLAAGATQQTSAATTIIAHAQEPAAVDEVVAEPRSKSRHDHHHHHYLPDTLPRAKLFGLYFPDLATTSKDEVRDYLQKSMQA
ncbi:MAG: hypothetical protein JOS17DRAFT_769249 [Linnemannia elongata]|nr:MAG: hypothetical protein JOS17DRAFT_769249 [Linnemannia elongata]